MAKVETELQYSVGADELYSVPRNEYATAIVSVLKNVVLYACGDYRGLNKDLEI